MTMTTSKIGVDQLTFLEGKRNVSYQDSIGVWTVGVGHTAAAGPPIPRKGLTLTDEQVEQTLASDLAKIYEPAILRRVKVVLTQYQFDALVCFVFNVGEGNFAKSTLLRDVNENNMTGAAQEFLHWNKAGGKVLAGLTRRREIEAGIFSNGLYTVTKTADISTTDEFIILREGGNKPTLVKELQNNLKQLKYYTGTIDGNFGPTTKLAVQAFQRSVNLSDDGIVGVKTSMAISNALAPQPGVV